MAEYVESKEKSQKATLDTQKAKLAALEKQLGIQTSSASAAGLGVASASGAAEAGSSTPLAGTVSAPSAPAVDVDVTKIAQKRHRFDDNQYFETSREINDGVRTAVTAGMSIHFRPYRKADFIRSAGLLKKRKKAKIEPANKVAESSATKPAASSATSTVAASA